MMIILLTNASSQLRGYLTRYLTEVTPGGFVGNPSARVRNMLWERVTDSLPESGKATLVYNINSEQGYKCVYHNRDDREIIDIDGLQVCAKIDKPKEDSHKGWSKAYWSGKPSRF